MPAIELASESDFSFGEIKEFKLHFSNFDKDGDGFISVKEFKSVLENMGDTSSESEVERMVAQVDADRDGRISWREFLTLEKMIRQGKGGAAGSAVKAAAKTFVSGAGGSQHSYTDEEKEAFVDHINWALKGDAHLTDVLPINPKNDGLFTSVKNGVLLCKLINHSVRGTIDERVINKPPKNAWEINENHTLALQSATGIGCSVVNIGPQDLTEGRSHLVLGLVWQIIKIGLLSQINLTMHPELARLLEEGETLEDLLRLTPEQLLLRWFNYHLREAGHPRRVQNFSGDIKDSECYTILLSRISGGQCSTAPLGVSDTTARANSMLEEADKIGCRKYVTARDVVRGNPKLNLAFTANLFNNYPALDPVEEVVIQETREERAFRMWVNSLGIPCQHIIHDSRDGLLLLKIMDAIQPGIVNWKRVTQDPAALKSRFKKLENCNYVVELAKQLNFSVVNIGGPDIMDGNQKLILGIVWQLMRLNIVKMLKELSGGTKEISDNDIIAWANAKLSGAGKSSKISSFNDGNIKTSVPLIDLCAAVSPKSVNYDLVTPGQNTEDAELNAKYAVSVARKMGATLFLLWEDIVEVKPKMIMTYVAGMMLVDKRMN